MTYKSFIEIGMKRVKQFHLEYSLHVIEGKCTTHSLTVSASKSANPIFKQTTKKERHPPRRAEGTPGKSRLHWLIAVGFMEKEGTLAAPPRVARPMLRLLLLISQIITQIKLGYSVAITCNCNCHGCLLLFEARFTPSFCLIFINDIC